MEGEKLERSLQNNPKYQGNISCKDGYNKGQEWYGPNRNRRDLEEWKEYTGELNKKDLNDVNNTMVWSLT